MESHLFMVNIKKRWNQFFFRPHEFEEWCSKLGNLSAFQNDFFPSYSCTVLLQHNISLLLLCRRDMTLKKYLWTYFFGIEIKISV